MFLVRLNGVKPTECSMGICEVLGTNYTRIRTANPRSNAAFKSWLMPDRENRDWKNIPELSQK